MITMRSSTSIQSNVSGTEYTKQIPKSNDLPAR